MRSILIADGDEHVARLFADLFAINAWNVTWYSDGGRARDTLGGTAHYDAVLVSSQLHGMSGLDLITRIRALDHRRGVPIVLVTGTADDDVAAAALTAGADDVTYKPTDVDSVVATVNTWVERGRAGIPDAGPAASSLGPHGVTRAEAHRMAVTASTR